MLNLQKVCAVFVSILALVNSARILGIFQMPAYSHFQLGDRIFKELAVRGHEVTVISPYELIAPVKNLRHVVLTGMVQQMEEMKRDLFKQVDKTSVMSFFWMDLFGIYFTELVLNHTSVQQLLNSNDKFDLVIQENFCNEALSGFSHRYNAPLVMLNPIGNSRWADAKMGNPSNPAYITEPLLSYSSSMSLFERVVNSVVSVSSDILHHIYTYPKHNQLLQKYIPGSPHLHDLIYNTSLMLLNSHPSISNPAPLLPNMIEIGGYHVQPPKPLPKDLQQYLDNAKDGFVYFSLGSNLKSRDMPEGKRDEILTALSKLKLKVLWKFENDVLPGQPSNVKLGKWFPQQDILAHPNIKLFITHGGMLSTIEAVYHGVPVLGIPVFGDQQLNIANAEIAGYGIGVPFNKLNEAALTAALSEVLTNPKYTENAKHRSRIMQDQTMKPLDRAIYWIEYVLRHQGAPHLKTAALNLQWYQYLLLDVVAVLGVGLLALLWIICRIVNILSRSFCRRIANKEKKLN